jgi:putative restriction endonuclease
MELDDFTKLNRAPIGDRRAPHKPILILLALAKYQAGHDRLFSFKEIQEPLRDLLLEYGPPTKQYRPELPFFHLKNDGVWDLEGSSKEDQSIIENLKSPKVGFFKSKDIHGGFPERIFNDLNDELIPQIALTILQTQFPESLHDDLLNSVGLNLNLDVKKKRNPAFRLEVLRAYESKCAVCNFRLMMNHKAVGIEAAHIKWHTYLGPDHITNGMALCSLHHKLFDRGVFTVNDHLRVVVSESAVGDQAFEELMLQYNGKELHKPIRPNYYPKDEYLHWHETEVFKGPGRYVANG